MIGHRCESNGTRAPELIRLTIFRLSNIFPFGEVEGRIDLNFHHYHVLIMRDS